MNRRTLANIYRLGVKELWSLWRDPMMLVLIIYVFTVAVYTAANAMPETLNRAPIAVVDEDDSALSRQIISAFYPPYFTEPQMISMAQMDEGMDAGRYTFALYIPQGFQRDVMANRSPDLQLNVDATRMSQAFTGSGAVQQIVQAEINEFLQRERVASQPPVDLVVRARFNPSLEKAWFGSLMQVINYITMLSIILTGAALIREREHGTIEHLLVMPVTPTEIMLAKIWAMGLVVLVAAAASLHLVVRGVLGVPVEGSLPLFFTGAALSLFATTSMGIFLATLARNMPQFGMLMMLTIIPLQLLSGGSTPRESMPELVQNIMLAAPTTHFVELGQAILYRGAGIETVWKPFLALALIGAVMFAGSLLRFRKAITRMA
ncbi:ABC transporter permease [Halopseudomonas formosensis]|uniref:ABC transporter permease n=1 Tax=Halopseudomonas formosensis TaxID=1002526 RepID=A0ABU5BVE2_9GAMM|nr:ABC transporter permease [Halopseudomonas formosensis]MDX9686742.1 ABC transporter permease [Halopseudomonas formosensis]